jgi:hypothetical protein
MQMSAELPKFNFNFKATGSSPASGSITNGTGQEQKSPAVSKCRNRRVVQFNLNEN